MGEVISIIVPVYNIEQYLGKCIDSILNQSYRELDIILVDDGSQDSSGDICDSYSKLDSRIRVIHKENGGVSDARNLGLDLARGEYISFIDGDDWVHSEFIERLYKLMLSRDCQISIGSFMKVYTEDVKEDLGDEPIFEYTRDQALDQLISSRDILFEISCGKLYKKSIFKQIRFPVGKVHEDTYIAHKTILESEKIVKTRAKLLYYRQRPSSTMNSGFVLKNNLDAIDAILERELDLSQRGIHRYRLNHYKDAYHLFIRLFSNVKSRGESVPQEYMEKYEDLVDRLNREEVDLKFKVIYRLHYRWPSLARSLISAYRKILKLFKRT